MKEIVRTLFASLLVAGLIGVVTAPKAQAYSIGSSSSIIAILVVAQIFKPSNSNRKKEKRIGDRYKMPRDLCVQALVLDGKPLGWSQGAAQSDFVNEAKRLGYTPERCVAVIEGRDDSVNLPDDFQASSETISQFDLDWEMDIVQGSIGHLRQIFWSINSAQATEELQRFSKTLYSTILSASQPTQQAETEWGN